MTRTPQSRFPRLRLSARSCPAAFLDLFALLITLLSPACLQAQTLPSAAPPVITPAAGQYGSAQTVTITDSTPGAIISYQLDNAPDTLTYTGPFTITSAGGHSVIAYATASGYRQSGAVTNNYTLALPLPAAPTISLPGGLYTGPQVVTLADTTSGATIRYTLDGTSPYDNPNRLTYTGPITLTTNAVIAAVAVSSDNATSPASSAQYIFTTSRDPFIYNIAGSSEAGFSGDGGPATQARLNGPLYIAEDAASNLYIAEAANFRIRKVAAGTGVITTYAGVGTQGNSGDGGPATAASFGYITSLVSDAASNLYFADQTNNVVRRIDAGTHAISTYAGNGINQYGNTGDGGQATAASLYLPNTLALSANQDLYIADLTCAVRKVTASTGIISTVLSGRGCVNLGDGGPASQASIGAPDGLATDTVGDLFISTFPYVDTAATIRKITAATGIISTVAGLPSGATATGNPQLAVNATFTRLGGLTLDPQGNLYFADPGDNVIGRIDATTGILTHLTSGHLDADSTYAGDAGPAIDAGSYPQQVILDPLGNLLLVDGVTRVRQIAMAPAQPSTPTPAPAFSLSPGSYNAPQQLTISDSAPGATVYVTLDGSTPSTLSQIYTGPISITGKVTVRAVAATAGQLASPSTDASYQITATPPAVIDTVAGSAIFGPLQLNVPATSTYLNTVQTVATDANGSAYFYSPILNQIFKRTPDGTLVLVAGNQGYGLAQSGVPATQTWIENLNSMALDRAGNLFFIDYDGSLVRRVDATTGIISTVAGQSLPFGPPLPNGDGGPAAYARFLYAAGLAFDSEGDLLIADQEACLVRRIDAITGIISSLFGTGTCGHTGDGGPASTADLLGPQQMAFGPDGDLFLNESTRYIRRISASTGLITTVAGSGIYNGASGDNGPALAAEISGSDLAVDADNNVYITDTSSHTVRRIDAATGIITSVVGNGYYGFSGDGGAATMASLFRPNGLAFDASGHLFIADSLNARIREVSAPVLAAAPAFSLAAGSYTSPQTITITDSTAGAAIFYTTDGSTPTASSTPYTGPVTLASTTTLNAIATAPGFLASPVSSALYTLLVPVTPTLTLTPAAATLAPAQSLTLVVTVSGTNGTATPTGAVTLLVGSGKQQANLAQGVATFQVNASALQPGTNAVLATYSGDANFTSVTANGAVGLAAVTASAAQPSAPISAGAILTTSITLAADIAYNGTLNLSCALTSSPPNAQKAPSCALTPTTLALTPGTSASVTASISTSAAVPAQKRAALERRYGWPATVTLASLLLFCRPRRRLLLQGSLSLGVAFVLLTLGGCGGGSAGTTTTPPPTTPAAPGTTAGSYTFSVTATDQGNTGITSSTSFTVQVQ